MASQLDPQVQSKLIEVAWKYSHDHRATGEQTDVTLKRFDKVYSSMLKTISGEPESKSK